MPPTEFIAHSADAKLACTRRGRGAPLLLITGVAGHQKVWNEQFLNRLAREYEVVTYDHRGIGDSSYSESFTLDDLVGDALAVLDWAGLTNAHVLGFSLGGAIAQHLAVSHAQRLRSLTLLSTWGDTDDVFGEGVLKFLAAGQAPDLETAVWMMFEANVSPAFAADAANFPAFRDAALAERVPTPVVIAQMAATATHNLIRRLAEVSLPTLVVHGTQDAVIRPACGERLAGTIPEAHLELWPGLGHHIAWEAPDRLADTVIKHVRKVS